ncbi:MAG: DUF3108 domain-containing protein [Alphaproteobacteria bacterium]|nr:DUF3108 domain-containing protein [Alphaproteobacteria bacterium]
MKKFILLALCSFVFASPAQAETQKAIYELYAGGINAAIAELDLKLDKTKKLYDVKLLVQTKGFLARLVPWSGGFATKGWLTKEKPRPEQHKSWATWKEDTESHIYNYKKDGTFVSLIEEENGKPKDNRKLDKELGHGTVDMLSVTLHQILQLAQQNECGVKDEVFDGKRRFALGFNPVAQTRLKSDKYAAYEGDAVECTIEVTPTGGAWHEKARGWMNIQDQGKRNGTIPTLWYANFNPADKGTLQLPVKVRVKTDYGTFFMHRIR